MKALCAYLKGSAVEAPLNRFRVKKGQPGTVIPFSFGLQQAWEVTTDGARRIEWRSVEVVGPEASDYE